ncbi:ATP-binding protein [Candidatus Poriferisodalis sp.]|uniref:ATP-binding protein n=1 Tax=Candidatus Poriferisodalis sp. TaxID=3101277 RepID=UPI003B010165
MPDESSEQSGTLTPAGYRARVADPLIDERLRSVGAVLIEGPKGCGKSWTALNHARSALRFDADASARRLAELSPDAVLEGNAPRLLDEWQLAPAIWNHVRHACDHSAEPGRFLLTGSAAPADDVTRHSGAGRIARTRLRPMSLFESGASHGHVSLSALLNGETVSSRQTDLEFRRVLDAICVGGWPWLSAVEPAEAQRRLREYVDDIRHTAIDLGTGRSRNPVLMERFFISLARHTASTTPNSRLAADAGGESPINHQTARAYVDALHQLFVSEDLPAWSTHLRSRSRLVKSPKRHFVDPSLAAAVLRASPRGLLNDLNTCGFLFESMVVRDLRVYADAAECDVFHSRLDNGTEADAVVQRRFGGEWIAAEVKLSHSPETTDRAADSLRRFVENIDTAHVGDPAALVVITAAGYAYTRPDGVVVTPISALGP